MQNKSSLSTILFGITILFFISATFAMFGAVVSYESASFPNMFQAAFGTGEADGQRIAGLTAIFSFQMIILVGIIAIIYGTLTHKFHYILTIIIFGIICLSSFIALIISFNAKVLYFAPGRGGIIEQYALGPGPIAYSVLHILGLVSTLIGLFFSRKGA